MYPYIKLMIVGLVEMEPNAKSNPTADVRTHGPTDSAKA